MRWREKTLEAMTGRLRQLGVLKCTVCGAGTMTVLRLPVVLSIGNVFRQGDPDPENNILFMVELRCEICGHVLLFDSETLSNHDEKALVSGMTQEEEAAWETEEH